MKRLAALPFAALLATACSEPYFEALTVPPPTRTAEMDASENVAKISRGVALAFECTYESAPCADASASVDDGAVASVFPAYVDLLSDTLYDDEGDRVGKKSRTVFVLLGVGEGKTKMRVDYGDGEATFDVEVVP